MSPALALFLCIFFIISLILLDFKKTSNISNAIWVPQLWLLIIASKPLSVWLNYIFGINFYSTSSENSFIDGSPIDRNFYTILIICGLLILRKRYLQYRELYKKNKFIIFFFVYCGISVLWSDYPFVSFKRWIKEIGNLTMVLVILTDINPVEAVKAIFRRLAYILMPLSIVLIKYFPEIGREFTRAGEAMYIGVTEHKNSLGELCVVIFIVFVWALFFLIKMNNDESNNDEPLLANVVILLLTVWCLKFAGSATATISVILGSILFLTLKTIVKNNFQYIGIFLSFAIIALLFFQYTIDFFSFTAETLERDLSFTGRTRIWSDLFEIGTNTIIGTGYDSYWLGDRTIALKERYVFPINQAHNGYLETYLNLGCIGLLLLIGMIVSGYRKICSSLTYSLELQNLRFVFLIIVLLMNITEAYFKGLSIIWFVFVLSIFELPPKRKVAQSLRTEPAARY